MTDLLNADAVMGHNAPPDHGAIAAERMEEVYGSFLRQVEELIAEAAAAPTEVTDDHTAGILAKLIKRLRDTTNQAISYHKVEKEPFLRAGQAVDRYFFGLIERCARRNRTEKPGAADILQARIDAWMARKLAEERRKREEEARIAREAEEAARKAREAEQRAAAEAAAKAERARKAENIQTLQAQAELHESAAREAAAQEEIAKDRRLDAQQAAAASPSEMVGTRVSDDVKLSVRREGYIEILDVDFLDMKELWPFIKDEEKIRAAKAWAKTTGFRKPMPGAEVGFRERSVVR